MKLISYYLQIILPLVILFWFIKVPEIFVIGILFYGLIYRPLIDGIRLIQIGSMEKRERGRLFIPFYRNYAFKYFRDLYFKF